MAKPSKTTKAMPKGASAMPPMSKPAGKLPQRGERTAKNAASRDPKKTGERLKVWMA
jgi:hypothetical protein